MTLRKVIQIKNVGRFRNFQVQGDQELRNLSLIFGENGRGKTTLSAILRSIKTGDQRYITERITLGATGNPEIEVLLASGKVSFNGTSWDKTCPEMEIFDHRFMTENVHVGDSVETKNQRGFAVSVILGEKGAKLAEQIKKLDETGREQLAAMRAAEAQLTPQMAGVPLQTFLSLSADVDIDTKIAAKTQELQAAKQATALQLQPLLESLPAPSLPAGFDATLSETLESVSATAEARVRAHLMQAHVCDAEEWLAEGVAYMDAESCPVCGQSIKGNELITAYKTYFSESYAALRTKVNDLESALTTSLGSEFSAAFARSVSANIAPTAYWQSYLSTRVPQAPVIALFDAQRQALLVAAQRYAASKKANLLEKMTPDESVTIARKGLTDACAEVYAYNTAVNDANAEIKALKAKSAAASTTTLESNLARLTATKNRHKPDVIKTVSAYWAALGARNKANADKASTQAELTAYSKAIVSVHESRINTILENFGAGFSIGGVQTTFPAGTPASTYSIVINKISVPAGKTPEAPAPCFQSMLSAGDKSALALAFFFPAIDQSASKAAKILALDDPFTSQDEHRRSYTCALIHEYRKICAQVIVSSHDGMFLRSVWDGADTANTKCLKLLYDGAQDSKIALWDIEHETKHAYLRLHTELKDYIAGTITLRPSDVIQKPRVLLEDYIRFRFPNTFMWNEWLGDMIARFETEGSSHPMFQHLASLKTINTYTAPAHHGSSTTAPPTPINEIALRTCVTRALYIVGKT